MAVASPAIPVRADVRSAPARGVLGLFFCLWAVFWLLMMTVSIQESLRDPGIRWWEPILSEGTAALGATCWLLIAMRARAYHAKYLDRPLMWFAYHLRWLPLVAVTLIPAMYAMRH